MRTFLRNIWDWLTGRRRPLGFTAATATDRGLVRAENQDAFACAEAAGFFCVADGMGGGEGGALASRWTCDALAAVWADTEGQPLAARETRLGEALQSVNGRIRAHARQQGYRVMGTTVAALLRAPEEGARARIFHVGDTRIYRLRHGRLDALTRDHTVGSELGAAMATARLDQAKALQARSNPLTHVLTRAVGTELRARPEWKTVDLQRGDRFLICSDGVHDMLSDADLAALLKGASSPRVAVARIEASVRHAGAGDNYTLVCADAVCRSRPARTRLAKT